MNYEETLTYLYNSAPLFQHIGKDAYKEGLENTYLLDAHFGHPHFNFKTIHVAGTNGKGSCSHTLAAILQSAGYKVGLFTSPHLIDFRERIRINGVQISQEEVINFVEKEKQFFEPLHPSFFELTTAMAFNYFSKEKVDVAVVEVGLGGRLDCTNIINPDLSIITNISFDHIQFLGNTLSKIASEKAGIIKPNTPVVIGEYTSETKPVFIEKAKSMDAPIYFAEETITILDTKTSEIGKRIYQTNTYKDLEGELGGLCQLKNTATILTATQILREKDYNIEEQHIRQGFSQVCKLTGLMGRWQKIKDNPTIICDTGHNVGGINYIVEQLSNITYHKLHIIMGMVNDKDVQCVLSILPKEATYYFTKASVNRAINEITLKEIATKFGLSGNCYSNVKEALIAAQNSANDDDLIFIGGSSFIVADFLTLQALEAK